MDKKSRTVLFSIASNALLLVFKLAAGVLTGSVSVLSEAVHSATDLTASLVAFVAVRRSEAPPDDNHHYGHARIENLAGTFEGLVLFAVGGWVIFTSVNKILHGGEVESLGLGMAVMLGAAVVNFFVSRWLLRVARETDSRAIEAEGYNLLTDVWGAAGVAVGLAAVMLTGWTFLDPIIAILIGLMILVTAFRLVNGSVRVLLDESLPEDEVQMLERLISEEIGSEPRILSFHKLRTRKSGSQRHVDFHLQLTPHTTLREAHSLSDTLEDKIKGSLCESDVLIHLEDDRGPRELYPERAEVVFAKVPSDDEDFVTQERRKVRTLSGGFGRVRLPAGLKRPLIAALALVLLLNVNGFLFYSYMTTSTSFVLTSATYENASSRTSPSEPPASEECDQTSETCVVAEAAP